MQEGGVQLVTSVYGPANEMTSVRAAMLDVRKPKIAVSLIPRNTFHRDPVAVWRMLNMARERILMPSVELFHHSSGRWRSTWLTGMFSLLAVLPAPASQIALTFSGTVTGSDTLGINVGDLYSGSLLYDTTDPFYVSNPPFDYYRFGETDMLTITVGSCTLSGFGPGTNSPNLLIVAHDQVFNGGSAGDLFGAVVDGSSNCGLFSPNGLAFEIVGPPGLLLDGGVPSSFDPGKIVQPGYSGYSTDVAATFSNGGPPCQSQNGTCFFQGGLHLYRNCRARAIHRRPVDFRFFCRFRCEEVAARDPRILKRDTDYDLPPVVRWRPARAKWPIRLFTSTTEQTAYFMLNEAKDLISHAANVRTC